MALNDLWSPQQEQKLQAWHRMQQVVEPGKPSPCFTIAREFGCQAYPLAEELIKRLNARVAGEPWIIVGRQVIDRVSELSLLVGAVADDQGHPALLVGLQSAYGPLRGQGRAGRPDGQDDDNRSELKPHRLHPAT